MKNKQTFLFLVVFASIFPIFIKAANGRYEQKIFGAYMVSLSQSFESGLGKLVIKLGKNKVFTTSEFDNHYYFGNHFDESLNEKDPHSGRDITGNGLPNLVISNWTGGAHCCNLLHIFEMGKKLRKLVTVEANSSSVSLIDLDHDGFPEIEFWDGAIDYLFASFGGSPGGRVVLKFKKDHYEVATHLMKKPLPNLNQMNIARKKIRVAFKKEKTPDLPYEFLNLMMELSYSGHSKLALKIATEEWPTEREGLSDFKEKFLQALKESRYWKEF